MFQGEDVQRAPDGWTTDDIIDHQYRQLIEALGRQLNHEFGWKRKVAEQLGIGPSYLSRIASGDKRAGVDIAVRAAQKLGFEFTYFIMYGAGYAEYVAEYKRLIRNKWADLDAAARELMEVAAAGNPVTPEAARELATRVENSEVVLRALWLRGSIKQGDINEVTSKALSLAAEITSEAAAVRTKTASD